MFVGLWFAVVIASLAPDLPTSSATDRAYWLVGNWHCDSYAGSNATRHYGKLTDGSLNMVNTVRMPSDVYVVMRERYTYDPATSSWSEDSSGNAVWGPNHMTAERWFETDWVFEGAGQIPEPPRGAIGPVRSMRMVYTYLANDVFRRRHQLKSGDRWRNYSEEVCTRDAPSP